MTVTQAIFRSKSCVPANVTSILLLSAGTGTSISLIPPSTRSQRRSMTFSQSAICMNIQLSEYEEPTFIFIFETPLSATIRSLGVHNGVA